VPPREINAEVIGVLINTKTCSIGMICYTSDFAADVAL
jgi:hypothetical protein